MVEQVKQKILSSYGKLKTVQMDKFGMYMDEYLSKFDIESITDENKKDKILERDRILIELELKR